MKFNLQLLVLLLFFSQTIFSQIIIQEEEITRADSKHEHSKHMCGTPPPDEATHRYILDNVIAHEQQRAATRNNVTNCLPMKIHIVRESNGSGGLSLGDLAIAMANLNLVYYEADIEFFVCGDINYIDDSDFYNFSTEPGDDDDEETFTMNEQVTDAINVFFMNSITIYNSASMTTFNAAGYARFPFNGLSSNRIFMINSVANNAPNSTFSHELGHYFSLYHTHEDTEFGNNVLNGAERVVRTGGNANCSTNGDLLCDTDADPRYSSGTFNFGNCSYTGNEMDDQGDVYTPISAIDNIMSYYPDQCGGVFTPGQYTRMASGLATRLTHTVYNYNCSAVAITPATGMTATLNGNQIDLTWTDNANNELGYIVERSSTSSTTGFLPIIYGGVGENIESFTDTEDIASSTTYWYRVKPVNSACDTYSNVASVTTGVIYCAPNYASGCTNSILDDFSMDGDGGPNQINNTGSGCNTNGYSSFTNLSADVTTDNAYSFTVCMSLNFGRFVEVWVDWNIDGDFDDPNEQILNGSFQLTPCHTAQINVPSDAVTGTTTMRVIIANGSAPTNPCGSYSFGETEDYTLNVSGIGGLPISLTSFEGKDRDESVFLSWETSAEIDNDYFTLERSRDGVQFEEFAKVEGAGTSDFTNYYSQTDFTPFDGENYYRLKQTDFDGKFTYSNVIVVDVKIRNEVSANVIPNPVRNDEFNLLYKAVSSGDVNVQIIDVNGKIVNHQTQQVETGMNSFSMDISNLSTGVYFLRTQQRNTIQTIRFVRL